MSRYVGYDGCECLRETEAALLVRFYDGAEQWIPKSQIDEGRSEILGYEDSGRVVLTRWIADAKDLGDPDVEYV